MRKLKVKKKTSLSIGGILVALVAALFYTIFGADVDEPSREGLIPVELVKTIDGDTIKIKYEGKEQNVRYLLIDTPETSHPRLGKQPFGEEAKKRNSEILNSGKLEIEFDIGERIDKYGRLLAYIYVDGESVQEKLIEEGLARVAYVYPPNTRYLDEFEKAQARAKKAGVGIWTLEDYATEYGFDSNAYPAKKKEQKSAAEPTEVFQNCTELRKKYPNGVEKGHPAYSEKMDGDKDGFACER
ncbi:thermonuclease family protein [Sporosarcina sp. HYO08]|uniref:thermonuclease family protein n=1 Tax=Sporosarcina sp. HYO08 TaxID=1759557 RepID=UPI000795B3FF|nr:thermonuclease family protein [Sporosarcina sp. HYO08]KXH86890.1 thermonuclease [Sporosarcina sp. HYO08]